MDFKCPICRTVINPHELHDGMQCPYCDTTIQQKYIEQFNSTIAQEENKRLENEMNRKAFHCKITFELLGKSFSNPTKKIIYDISPTEYKKCPWGYSSVSCHCPNGEYTVSIGWTACCGNRTLYRDTHPNTSSTKIQINDNTSEVIIYYKRHFFNFIIEKVEYKEEVIK